MTALCGRLAGISTLSRLVSFSVWPPTCHCPPRAGSASSADHSSASGAFHRALLDHVAAGEALTSSLVLPVLTDLGWSSASHPVHGVLVALVEQHPLLALARRAAAHEREVAVQLLAEQIEVQVAGLDGCDRVVGVGQLPRAPVPHDHVAAAVLAGRDHALEVEVPERMVLDVDRHPLRGRIERRALRHRPAEQHARRLEPQVVVQPGRPVALHDEPVARRRRRRRTVARSPDGSGVTEKSRLRRYVVSRSAAARITMPLATPMIRVLNAPAPRVRALLALTPSL